MIFLRSCLFNLWFYLGTAGFAIAGLVPRLLSRWLSPYWAMGFVHNWAAFILTGMRALNGIRYEIAGAEHLPRGGAALLVPMHQSAFDTIVWFYQMPRATYVLKQELMKIPLVGGILRALGLIAVDRDAGAAAIRLLMKETDRAVAEERQMVIFPEGTRVTPGEEAPLHPGYLAIAARSRLPVIPITTDSGLCWGRRAFRKRPGTIHITVHPPLPADLPRAEIARRVEAIFAEARAAIRAGAR